MSSQMKAVKIIETQERPDGKKYLTKIEEWSDGTSLEQILCNDDVKNLPILVFSVTGKTRLGKSFLLNLMAKYLDTQGRQGWYNEPIQPVFTVSDGLKSCTKGLWICPKVFKLKYMQVGILLMDNEGLFDGDISSEESITMCSISTLVSYLQMFNMSNRITSDALENTMCFLKPSGCEPTEHQLSKGPTGSRLMFIVRDFKGGKEIGFGLENGQVYINEESMRGSEEHKSMWKYVNTLFEKVECLPLPHPGSEIDDFTSHGDLIRLKPAFTKEVDEFFRNLFAPHNLTPYNLDMTGSKLYIIISQADGTLCSESHSYYNMLLEQKNQSILQEKVKMFNDDWLKEKNSLPKAQNIMKIILDGTEFMGPAPITYRNRLRKNLEAIINLAAVNYIVDDYKKEMKDNIVANHNAKWPESLEQLKAWVNGTEEEKTAIKQTVGQKIAEIYCDKIENEKKDSLKKQFDDASPSQLQKFLAAFDTPKKIQDYINGEIIVSYVFELFDISKEFLDKIFSEIKDHLKKFIESLIKRNQFVKKEIIVNLYKNRLGCYKILSNNEKIWPDIVKQLNSLTCESEKELIQLKNDIIQEVATIYYRRLREELASGFKDDCESKNANDFYIYVYQKLQTPDQQEVFVSERFIFFKGFQEGTRSIWANERSHFSSTIKDCVLQGLMTRGYVNEAKSFLGYLSGFISVGVPVVLAVAFALRRMIGAVP